MFGVGENFTVWAIFEILNGAFLVRGACVILKQVGVYVVQVALAHIVCIPMLLH